VGTDYAVCVGEREGDGPFAIVVTAWKGSEHEDRVGMISDEFVDLRVAAREVNLDPDVVASGRLRSPLSRRALRTREGKPALRRRVRRG
jgi:hypothetical protein